MAEEINNSVTIREGENSLMNPAAANHMWKMATMLAKSEIVPKAYQGKPENCLVCADYANRIGMPVLAVMQNLAVINGKPSLEAKMVIAMVNSSDMFKEDLQYEVKGSDPRWDSAKKAPKDQNYMVRAFATLKNGRMLTGPWITWDMVQGEGWVNKDGSKWKTMPEMMFQYRAASFFVKVHCPQLTMGMQTVEEMIDSPVDRQEQRDNVRDRFRQPVDVQAEMEEAPESVDLESGITPEEEEALRKEHIREFGTEEEKRMLEEQENLFK